MVITCRMILLRIVIKLVQVIIRLQLLLPYGYYLLKEYAP